MNYEEHNTGCSNVRITANVQDLTEKVRNGFENADLVPVQAIGLRFEDNEIAKGILITPA